MIYHALTRDMFAETILWVAAWPPNADDVAVANGDHEDASIPDHANQNSVESFAHRNTSTAIPLTGDLKTNGGYCGSHPKLVPLVVSRSSSIRKSMNFWFKMPMHARSPLRYHDYPLVWINNNHLLAEYAGLRAHAKGARAQAEPFT